MDEISLMSDDEVSEKLSNAGIRVVRKLVAMIPERTMNMQDHYTSYSEMDPRDALRKISRPGPKSLDPFS